MKCYMCDKPLGSLKENGYVCICNSCLVAMERAGRRIVEKICEPTEISREIQSCGHPVSEIVSSDEGTSYCGACEREVGE